MLRIDCGEVSSLAGREVRRGGGDSGVYCGSGGSGGGSGEDSDGVGVGVYVCDGGGDDGFGLVLLVRTVFVGMDCSECGEAVDAGGTSGESDVAAGVLEDLREGG